MKTLPFLLGGLLTLVTGCANQIRMDQSRWRASLPDAPVVVLERKAPGLVDAGLTFQMQHASVLHDRDPKAIGLDTAHGQVHGEIPPFGLSAHASVALFESVSLLGGGQWGFNSQNDWAQGFAGVGLHATAMQFAWQFEGLLGASWARTNLRYRVKIDDRTQRDSVFFSEVRRDSAIGLRPWLALGAHLSTNAPRSPLNLWGGVRYAVMPLLFTQDVKDDASYLECPHVVQLGGGIWRRFGKRQRVMAGLRENLVFLKPWSGLDVSTQWVFQYEVTLSTGFTKNPERD